jgi:hypothetical protein
MIEHKHWQRKSTDGILDQHIAIVGYSHYRKEQDEPDSSRFTQSVMRIYLDRDQKMGAKFFPPIERYFGFEDRKLFWNRVLFFNLVPECFSSDNKYGLAGMELKKRAQARFEKILSVEKPDKVFVFSRKGWNQCPDTPEEPQPLKSNPRDTWRTYSFGGHSIRACGFRHPLFTEFEGMRSAVQEFLEMR